MMSQQSLHEFHSAWLPNITRDGLDRLIELLEKGSPLLIHGSFTRAVPQGCLATQIAWNHPATTHLTQEAGIAWLHHVAGLNPATSHVIREWDRGSCNDFEIRAELLGLLLEERSKRHKGAAACPPAPCRPRPPLEEVRQIPQRKVGALA